MSVQRKHFDGPVGDEWLGGHVLGALRMICICPRTRPCCSSTLVGESGGVGVFVYLVDDVADAGLEVLSEDVEVV